MSKIAKRIRAAREEIPAWSYALAAGILLTGLLFVRAKPRQYMRTGKEAHPPDFPEVPVSQDAIDAAMARAEYKRLANDEGWWGEIPGFEGVWANADTPEACRKELESVLRDWISFSVWKGLPIPTVDGVELVSSSAH